MKRFYREATVGEAAGGWQVMLDGRGIKTQGGRPQVVPSRDLAEELAAEWAAQGEEIDPKSFRLRDQTDYAIDHVASDPSETIDKLVGFAETDTLCYRADPEDALFKRQQEEWEPVIGALESRHAIRLHRISGIMHRAQPEASMAVLRRHLETLDPFTLAGLFTLASLAASLCIALEAAEPDADVEKLWAAASLEEEWQADLWGRDAQAEERRARRAQDFLAAVEWLRLARA
ncbi:ATP12 family protein [Altererythrobacter arenosus]|uniref:ATP12 family protein n=1 Tax=Altererythrobacter arenosus TaxID=3032592 RepID=A0ABY8FSU5_9SPHN|nr:ATP12 family protein [Altererythrobacter sp. CAU 1644]WFL78087.1 ATP12 family protein [Altererythrobacter sp. CAU 1644]